MNGKIGWMGSELKVLAREYFPRLFFIFLLLSVFATIWQKARKRRRCLNLAWCVVCTIIYLARQANERGNSSNKNLSNTNEKNENRIYAEATGKMLRQTSENEENWDEGGGGRKEKRKNRKILREWWWKFLFHFFPQHSQISMFLTSSKKK